MFFPFPLHWTSLPPFFQIRSSLSSLVLPFPLYSSLLSCTIFSPCRPGPAPGTWYEMILESFYHLPFSLQSKPFFETYFQIFLKLLWTDLELVLNQCDILMEWSCSYYTQLIFAPVWDIGVFIFEWLGDRFEIVLVSFWDRFGIILEHYLDHVGIILGSFWDYFGIIVG